MAVGKAAAYIGRRKEERLEEVLREVEGGLPPGEPPADEGEMKDLLAEAIPVIESAETKAKREMIAALLLNAFTSEDTVIARFEASKALHLIGQMSDRAAVLFGWVSGDYQCTQIGNIQRDRQQDESLGVERYHGIGLLVLQPELEELKALGLLDFARRGDSETIQIPAGSVHQKIRALAEASLSILGVWLADWTTRRHEEEAGGSHPPGDG